MNMSNQELINKAMVATDALAAAGKLNPEQANKFIDYVFDLTMLKGKVRTVKFKPDQLDIDKINVGQRVTVAKNEATDPGVRMGVSTSKVTLRPKEIMTPFEISDDFMEYNIESESVEDHVIKMMATQMANDIEELLLDGDVQGPARIQSEIFSGGSATHAVKDTYIALLDGWLKLARGANVVDLDGANVSSTVFSDMINALPEKYKRNKANLKFMTASNIEQNYRQVIGSRATSSGDTALSTQVNLSPFGIELVPVPLFGVTPRVTKHLTLTGTTVASLDFKNIITDSEVVTLQTLNVTPIAPYVEGVDYTMDYVNGTIVRIGAGAIPSGANVKVTSKTESQMLLTAYMNLIFGMGRDIRIEKDRDIFKGVNQYAITAKVACEIENLEALVWAKNIGRK
jgi:hypothetical protein